MPMPTTISSATRRLNPDLFKDCAVKANSIACDLTIPGTRIRQQAGTGLNKLETAWLDRLHTIYHEPTWQIRPHGITLKIANGCRYTPDFFVTGPELIAFEVKGPHAWDDAIVKLKVAASTHRWLTFFIVTRTKAQFTEWHSQKIIP